MSTNTFMNQMKRENNIDYTENGGVTRRTTESAVFDLFALGGSYRQRSDEDVILLFKNAFEENQILALKCLFYLRDRAEGQGERRFFRVAYRWLCENYPAIALKYLEQISYFGRWDDLIYIAEGTPIEAGAFELIKSQLLLDMVSKTPSLLAKWMPSQNASNEETKRLGYKLANYLNLSSKDYRKILSDLRKEINVLERLMSQNHWDQIEFDKIPSRAGIIYRNAFARRDILAKKYEAFAKNKATKVNAAVLYPNDIAHKAFGNIKNYPINSPERLMLQKYWDNLKDYYNGRKENGIAVIDVSGSMTGTPLEAAVSMGAYIADKAHGPFANHFITFSSKPELVKFEGVDIVDKFNRCVKASWQMNTNIQAVFDMLLRIAKNENVSRNDMPTRLYIFSDMEFDSCISSNCCYYNRANKQTINSDLERIERQWAREGYKLPQVIFWNLNARHNNIPALGKGFNYISGFSPVMIENILSGKDGYDLMIDKLMSDRYKVIC